MSTSDAPEADLQEQRRPVGDDELVEPSLETRDYEAPEADAFEQALPAELDEEERR